jgi:homoaconitate hydratase
MHRPGRTAIEKLVARHAVGWTGAESPRAGDFVTMRPAHVMTHDNTSAVIAKFHAIAGPDGVIRDPTMPVFAMDHDIQNHTPENLGKYARIRAFAARHGIAYFPPGRGIAHQVMIEEGFVRPGTLVVGSDSHSNMYGALGALGTPIVRTDAAALWATGRMWWTVPAQARVTVHGRLPDDATGKDVILALCAAFGSGDVLNTAIEFAGEGLASLTVEDRMTIANMTTEWGALAALFPFDDVLREWLIDRARLLESRPDPQYTESDVAHRSDCRAEPATDGDAMFAVEIDLDLASVSPHVTGPNTVTRAVPVAELAGDPIRIDKAYLMSCVNGRLTDLEAAAAVFGGGRRVAEGVEFYIGAASSEVEVAARGTGAWQTLIAAGAIPLPPGCGACIGLGRGTLQPGEVGISATNRNFEGRMGSRDAACYLASPVVVAESAARGFIASPSRRITPIRAICRTNPAVPMATVPQDVLDGFPSAITGRTLLVPADDLNTDGIYGKDVTYRDDIALAEQGEHAMRTYDPTFRSLVQRGDILIAGRNFGCGSSREQAATALQSAGIAMMIASSIAQTYQRNAFNNGLIVIECPEAAECLLRDARSRSARTAIGPVVRVDFRASTISIGGERFVFAPLNRTAQELIVADGLERLVLSERTSMQESAV